MFSFWSGSGNWQGYKATTVLALTGAVKNLFLENYWVFTNIPLSGQDVSEPASKFFYSCGLLIAGAVLWGGVGLGVDYLRSAHMERNPTEDTRLKTLG